MAELRVISADSHVVEPANLWVERLDKKFRDRAPRVVKTEAGDTFVAEGVPPFNVASVFAAGIKAEDYPEHLKKGFEACRPGGWDPIERIKDQNADGVEAEVLYTSMGFPLFRIRDADLQRACFRVYNDWLAEFTSHNPKRLIGIGLIDLQDIKEGIKGLERCAKQGLKGVMIWASPPADKPYSSREYDSFWEAAQDLHIPLSLHIGTGKSEEIDMDTFFSNILTRYTNIIHEVQRSLTDIVLSGVLERFPKLMIVSAENDIGWIYHWMYRMDHAYEKYRYAQKESPPMKPSEYVRRQLYATFMDDPVGPATYKFFGEHNYMWGSDFPHADSTWPYSRKMIEQNFAGVPMEVTRKVAFENATKLYSIEI